MRKTKRQMQGTRISRKKIVEQPQQESTIETPAEETPAAPQYNQGPFIRDKEHPKKAPYLAADGSKTAIVLHRGYKKLRYVVIENSLSSSYFIKSRVVGIDAFERQYDHVSNYDVERAAQMYVRMAEQWGSGPAVLEALKAIATGSQTTADDIDSANEGDEEMAAKKKAAAAKGGAKKAVKTSAPAEKKQEKAVKAKKVSKRINDNDKLYPQKENPWREGSKGHKLFGMVKNGMTVGAYKEAGGEMPHLQWDIKHGRIKVEKAE